MSHKPHSAAVLTELRDDWWSTDFLRLMVERLQLHQYERILDVGSGQGHWGQRLLPLVSETATLVGVDQESSWVEKATHRAAEVGLEDRCSYQVSSAETLPLADASVSLVTCQTLLMHVPDPGVVVDEMLRVLEPGGRLLLLEPNNLAQQFAADSVYQALTAAQIGHVMTLFVTCSRGRAALGRGDDCIGDRLPKMLATRGLGGISVFQNERNNHIVGPYGARAQAQLDQAISYARDGFWLWNEADAKELYAAGGGELDAFRLHYDAFKERTALFHTQVQAGTYTSNNGSLHYVVSAIKPAA